MIMNPFSALAKPKLKYPVVGARGQEAVREIPVPSRIFLHLKGIAPDKGDHPIKPGDGLRTGQRLDITADGENFMISPVTGTVAALSAQPGYLGQVYHVLSIDVAEESPDAEFEEKGRTPNSENAARYLGSLPGAPDFASLINAQPPLDVLVVNGTDRDLLITTNQEVVKNETAELREGLNRLKEITGVKDILLVVPADLKAEAMRTGVEVAVVDLVYPDTLPKILVKSLLGREVPAGGRSEDVGVGFLSAEAVSALAQAFSTGKIPVEKRLTVIGKDGMSHNVRARIGTPIRAILEALNIEAGHGDRVVLGGPMTGRSVFSEETPISHDTDAIMIQDKRNIVGNSDVHCVNCGECVRACPANVPVNMLIRFLENRLYEEAAEQYDLHSCIECGLCSYVCIARIPIFQYIMLGKYELAQIQLKNAEGFNA